METITVNYLAILVCGIVAMMLWAIWYGPLFGNTWMHIIGATTQDIEERKKMQKKAAPLYAVQFLLTLFQVWVLAYYISGWQEASGVTNALWIWAAFVVPTIAGSAMWNNDTTKIKWTRFLIQAGYQLVSFMVFGSILYWWK